MKLIKCLQDLKQGMHIRIEYVSNNDVYFIYADIVGMLKTGRLTIRVTSVIPNKYTEKVMEITTDGVACLTDDTFDCLLTTIYKMETDDYNDFLITRL